ncbi:MAG: hypothetical protein ACYC7E_13425 [Armatimonadota bacterium]
MKLTGIEVFIALFALSISPSWANALRLDAEQAPTPRTAQVREAKSVNASKLPVPMTPEQASTLQAKYQVWTKAESGAVPATKQVKRAKSFYGGKARTYGAQPLQRTTQVLRKEQTIAKAQRHQERSSDAKVLHEEKSRQLQGGQVDWQNANVEDDQ